MTHISHFLKNQNENAKPSTPFRAINEKLVKETC